MVDVVVMVITFYFIKHNVLFSLFVFQLAPKQDLINNYMLTTLIDKSVGLQL